MTAAPDVFRAKLVADALREIGIPVDEVGLAMLEISFAAHRESERLRIVAMIRGELKNTPESYGSTYQTVALNGIIDLIELKDAP